MVRSDLHGRGLGSPLDLRANTQTLCDALEGLNGLSAVSGGIRVAYLVDGSAVERELEEKVPVMEVMKLKESSGGFKGRWHSDADRRERRAEKALLIVFRVEANKTLRVEVVVY